MICHTVPDSMASDVIVYDMRSEIPNRLVSK